MAQTAVYYALPDGLADEFSSRLRETGLGKEYRMIRVSLPLPSPSRPEASAKDGGFFLSPELALVYLLASAKEVIDDYVDRFNANSGSDDDDSDGPMTLSDEDFKFFVQVKRPDQEDICLWSQALDNGWVLINGTYGVGQRHVIEARNSLTESCNQLEVIRNRVQAYL